MILSITLLLLILNFLDLILKTLVTDVLFFGLYRWDVSGGVENYETVCFLHKFLYAFVFLLLNVHLHLQSDEFSK